MSRRLTRIDLLLVSSAVSILTIGCVTQTRQYGFEVKRGTTIEERIETAKAVVTEARLERLKLELKQRYPELTDAHLEHFGIRWTENWAMASDGGKANRSVTIVVIMEERAGVEAADVVEGVARILDAEINGPVNSAIEGLAK